MTARFQTTGQNNWQTRERTAGMRAKSDPKLQPIKLRRWPILPEIIRFIGGHR